MGQRKERRHEILMVGVRKKINLGLIVERVGGTEQRSVSRVGLPEGVAFKLEGGRSSLHKESGE